MNNIIKKVIVWAILIGFITTGVAVMAYQPGAQQNVAVEEVTVELDEMVTINRQSDGDAVQSGSGSRSGMNFGR